MTDHVRQMKDFLLDRSYRQRRRTSVPDLRQAVTGKNEYQIAQLYLAGMLEYEEPVIYEHDIFGFNRSFTGNAECDVDGVCAYPGRPGNITVNYNLLIDRGLLAVRDDIRGRMAGASGESLDFYTSLDGMLTSTMDFCARYREAAKAAGNPRLYEALCNVPQNRPNSFYEACLFQKIIIFLLRVTRHNHITLGRFDQYMYPYFQADLDRGVPAEELFETLELYFLALNVDSDTYEGVQMGDNGQSMVLGGFDADGASMFNELSRLCMEASLELEVIDPKINLRVGKNTPDELYELGTRLTKKGLGFPQYCNDDVVVPGLTRLGYDYADALDYTVAACWEYIIPGKSMDIPNVATFNFPQVVSQVIRQELTSCESFEALMERVDQGIIDEVHRLIDKYHGPEHFHFGDPMNVSPLLSLMTQGCVESGCDIARGGTKYYCQGSHGAGISTAADSLAAVKKLVYDEGSVSKELLLTALEQNFDGYTDLRNQLLACPKMGNDDDYVDDIALRLMGVFTENLNGQPTGVAGGFWRAGTGSAMEYILSARAVPATADGRYSGDPYGSSYSPSLNAKLDGPLSVIRSFTKFDLKKIINGGPLTMEMHDNVFRNAEGEKKVADLVKLFVLCGGHQLQLNAINRERLLDAQKHPENYPNLVVRVWGWSGYFCELDPEYQNHIIKRTEFSV